MAARISSSALASEGNAFGAEGARDRTQNPLEAIAGPSRPATDAPAAPREPSLLGSFLPADNPLFTGGLSLMVIGASLAAGRKAIIALAELGQRRMLVSLEIPSRDRAHPWFLAWMSARAQELALRRGSTHTGGGGGEPSRLRALLSRSHDFDIISHDLAVETSVRGPGGATQAANLGDPVHPSGRAAAIASSSQAASGDAAARFSLVPGPGTHYFRFRGVWMRLHRERAERLLDVTTGAPWETIKLTTLYSARHLLPRLLEEARELSARESEGKTVIYTAWGPEWRPFGQPRRPRELESVVLRAGVKEELVKDVENFMQREGWYAERGIPYRRGYLLYGPPGSGKSSLITALAGYHKLNICLLSLSDRGLTDDKLLHLLANAPERSILILEDIDVAFASRDAGTSNSAPRSSSSSSSSSGSIGGGGAASPAPAPASASAAATAPPPAPTRTNITFSGLLNALDGVASSEERIVFMTTNYPERLDPALVRPGRVDRRFELGDAEGEQVRRMMGRFYGAGRGRLGAAAAAGAGGAGGGGGVEEGPSVSAAGEASASASASAELEKTSARFARLVMEESARRRSAAGLDPHTGLPLRSESASASAFSSAAAAAGIAWNVGRGGVSMAEVQGWFIREPESAGQACDAWERECRLRWGDRYVSDP